MRVSVVRNAETMPKPQGIALSVHLLGTHLRQPALYRKAYAHLQVWPRCRYVWHYPKAMCTTPSCHLLVTVPSICPNCTTSASSIQISLAPPNSIVTMSLAPFKASERGEGSDSSDSELEEEPELLSPFWRKPAKAFTTTAFEFADPSTTNSAPSTLTLEGSRDAVCSKLGCSITFVVKASVIISASSAPSA
ncbi:hypothetical protein PHLGIDRAFT_169555 [Phlebiopsis gigantea 11061_1 CR5-6]|uniref:Uncharacterized protein n=1 Tax=Phlebiopsis gigantea (strain 11061_1 CR5-6) TaxID=745531 RepID=A0A0C3PGT5_PHLG1|nr:hypothetical protein PHLGIDRAFT_169555 [Phlebiopsis gigantea 11061_1 CR5-6]